MNLDKMTSDWTEQKMEFVNSKGLMWYFFAPGGCMDREKDEEEHVLDHLIHVKQIGIVQYKSDVEVC